jgi:glycosyltransferase involved in cell wall biosynthesis
MTMRIGINTAFARKPQTGIGQVSINLVNALAKHHPQLDVVLYGEEETPGEMIIPSHWKYENFLPAWKRDDLIRKIFWEKQILPKKVRADKCDVFVSAYQCPTVIDGYIRHIMIVHDLIPKIFPEYLNNWRKRHYQSLTEKGIRSADRLIAVSKKTEKDLIEMLGVPGAKITTGYVDVDPSFKNLPDVDDISRMLQKYSLRSGYILGGGGLEKRKNIDGLIKAYHFLIEKEKSNSLPMKLPDLVIFGATNPSLAPLVTDVEKIVKRINLSERIKIIESVEKKYLPVLYNQASIFAYPSFYEGFGLPILEAMNQATAVVASDRSSIPEIGQDVICYCDPDKPHDIASKIEKLITDKILRDTLVQRGKARAGDFSWKNFVDKLINIAEQE